jgi:hypothetical protein
MRDRRRSEIILLSAEGLTQQRIAERMGRRFCIRSGNALEFVKSKPFDCTTRSGGGQQ